MKKVRAKIKVKVEAEILKCQEREAADVARLKQYWAGCVAGLKTALIILEEEK